MAESCVRVLNRLFWNVSGAQEFFHLGQSLDPACASVRLMPGRPWRIKPTDVERGSVRHFLEGWPLEQVSEYRIVIPSYKRPGKICAATLSLLRRHGVPLDRITVSAEPGRPEIQLDRSRPDPADSKIQGDEPPRSREVSARPGRPENPEGRAPSI